MRKICLVWFILAGLAAQARGGKVLVMKIRAEIDPRMSRYVHLALEKATEIKADAVLIDMDTFGGALDDADKIRKELLDFKKPIFVFINKNAASAGALISIACDSIYMQEGSNIGAATVVTGEGVAAPDKYQSYMRSLMRSTAEANHRDPRIAEGMVDQNIQMDTTIKKDGKVITFTTSEAIKYGFCEQQLASTKEVLSVTGFNEAEVIPFELDWSEGVISFFINPAISSVLILIILGGIYFELQTPGVGFPLLAAIVAAVLYFVPYYMNGLAENWELLVFVIGLGFLVAEIFFIPGFGVAGIAGIVLCALALVLIMVNNTFFDFTFVPSGDVVKALIVTLIGIIGSVFAMIFGAQRLMGSKYMSRVALHQVLKAQEDPLVETWNAQSLKGKTGIAHTPLRPSGKVQVDKDLYDALSNGEFISAGETVEIIEVHAGHLKVRKG